MLSVRERFTAGAQMGRNGDKSVYHELVLENGQFLSPFFSHGEETNGDMFAQFLSVRKNSGVNGFHAWFIIYCYGTIGDHGIFPYKFYRTHYFI